LGNKKVVVKNIGITQHQKKVKSCVLKKYKNRF